VLKSKFYLATILFLTCALSTAQAQSGGYDSPDKSTAVETVKTLPRAKTMALDPKTHRLFLSTAENGQFEVLVAGK
jgi:hypothetical protein